jgi:hypothetical protein
LNAAGQPVISPGTGLISTDWLPGPSDGTQAPVVVSFTDFHTDSNEDWQQVAELGMKLAESWPIMRGAVGLWLWGKPAEWRGGSLSVWDTRADLSRFFAGPFTPPSSRTGGDGYGCTRRAGMACDSSQPGHGFAPRSSCELRAICPPVVKAAPIDGATCC